MKNIATFLLLILFITLAPAQQPQLQATQPSSDERELLRLSQEWMEAAMQRDEAKLNHLMADEFTLLGLDASRPPVPKANWIENTMQRLRFTFKYTSLGAKVYGDFGVVTSTYMWEGTLDDKPFSDAGFIADVWRKKDGRWQVVVRRGAPLSRLIAEGVLPPCK